ncbi:hypothetical protein ABT324_00580 [Saccharopolyspora sp. NPDC000359]
MRAREPSCHPGLVDAYPAATGRTAAEALLADSREVIDTALVQLR